MPRDRNMLHWRYMLPVWVASTLLGQTPGTDLFQHVRPWLPAEIEVAYISNLPLKSLSLYHAPSPLADYARLAALAVAELDSPEPLNNPATTFRADAAIYAGGGYRLLNPPAGLGLQGRFEGCSFLLSSKGAVDAYLRLAKVHGSGPSRGGIYRLGSTKEPDKEIFVSAAEPNLLAICSDRALAERILARKKQGARGVVFGPDNAEWKLVDVNAPAWGLRHFAHAPPDPTSPLGGARGLPPGYSDPQAVAMAFTLESATLARVVYMTRRQSGNSGYGKTWGISSTSSTMQDYRLISMQFDPSADANGDYQSRLMLMLLGIMLAV